MEYTVREIPFQKETLILGFIDDRPVVAFLGKKYFSVNTLLAAYPRLTCEEYLKTLSLVVNFLLSGLSYSVIEDIPAYQKRYVDRRQMEMNEAKGTVQYGYFDVSVIHPPKMEDGLLTFFVESSNFDIPYKFTCHLSNNEISGSSYSLLPH
jgi:hypothetical protein